MALSGWLIARHGYTPVFIGYGLMPVIAALLILFGIGALRRDPRFDATDRRRPAPAA